MDSIVVVAEARAALIDSPSQRCDGARGGGALEFDGEMLPESQLCPPTPPATSVVHPVRLSQPNQRLASLDVFRGLTIAFMILVDDAGGAFPAINHAPWFGVTIADFVMPSFLFSVGVSIALVCRKATNKIVTTRKVLMRTIKLFFLGVLLQGGYFHGRNHWTYGVDIDRIRWLGVLQRIAIGYFLVAMSEIWLSNNRPVHSPMSFTGKYYIQWFVVTLLSVIYIGFLLGLYVPNWEFEVSSSNSTLSISNFGHQNETVYCGLRGNLSPPCNAVGFIDRLILGERHLYQHPVYKRTKECSINSPDYGPLPPNSPGWCLAPFDPEGILSSVMAAVTCFAGLQFGHVIVHVQVDVKHIRKPTLLFQWMGMNALIVFVLAACELFPIALQGFYWKKPSNNLVNLTESVLQTILHSKKWGTLAFVFVEILFWCLASGFLHMKGIYFKL